LQRKKYGDSSKANLIALVLKIKQGDKSHFEYKLRSIIERVYGTIRKFETTTASFHDSKVIYQKEMKWFTEIGDTLEQNQKVMIKQ
jgi:IS5 family transposase